MALETFTTTAASLTLTTGEMLELQPGTNQVLTHLDGWFSPAGTRREGTARLWAHGSFSERGWRDQRVITLGGHIFTGNRGDAARMTDTLAAALADGTAGKFIVNDADLGYREATVFIQGTPTVNWDGNLDIFFMIDMVAPDPRKYGLPLTASTLAAAPGGGLAFDLFGSGGYVHTSPGNLANNAAPYDGNGWGTSGAYVRTYEIINGRPAIVVTKSGTGSYLWYGRNMGTTGTSTGTPTSVGPGLVPITPGQTAYASVDMGVDTAGFDGKITLRFFNSSGTEIGSSAGPVTAFSTLNSWQTFTHSAVAPANSAYFYAENVIGGTTVGGERGWAGDAYLGTTPPVASTGTAGVLDFGAAGSPGTATLENVGTADAAPVFTITGYAPGFTITEVSTGARLIYSEPVLEGQRLVINAGDGSVLLDGYADRSGYLTRREWTRVPGRTRNTYLFESPGNTGAQMTLEMRPAWW
ncbi:phage tail family protein [Arthrobacter sp. EPSL27]|uniref:phage tail family protein n=1 Tax=Arthrobacter sp. EPSL27 TaxID=1745378 RepID=UPI0007488F19|nr:phage tail family protein [Arthrobacter sp. EPSL27]KUM41195.1 hypothetical protein AR539_00725 [Arthrobacter sp. EPSL27]